MPIYEFFCRECNTLFNFLSARVNTEKIPDCPRCGKALTRKMSIFATIGKAKEPAEDSMPDIDEYKMERALGELAGEAENINEDDPKQMANLMRKFSEKSGLNLGDGMEEALSRLESGEDPEAIEQEMGELFEGDDMMGMFGKKVALKGGKKSAPIKDETLYTM